MDCGGSFCQHHLYGNLGEETSHQLAKTPCVCYHARHITRSSNGRTEAFEAFNWGSSPCRVAMGLLSKIKHLNLPEKEFVILGSGILEVKGIRKANDLDILIKEYLFKILKESTDWTYIQKIGKKGDKIDLLLKDNVQLYFHVYGEYSFDYFMEDKERVEEIENIYFSSLKESKRFIA